MPGRIRRWISATQARAEAHYVYTPDAGWTRWIAVGAAVIVGVNFAAAIHQRWMVRPPGPHGPVDVPWHNGYSIAWTLGAAAVAFAPYLLDAIGVLTKYRIGLPLMLFPIPVAVGIGYLVFHPTANDFAPFVLVFTAAEVASRARELGARGEKRRFVGLWGWILGVAVMLATDVFGPFEGSFIWVVGISFGYFGGFMVGELNARREELELAQSGLAEKAATEERSRIAREVHDVIAHSLSVTMLHVSAARMALARGRTDDALEALEEAEKQGRSSLGEVRRTVGLLGPDESATAAPMPGLLDLPRLAADFRNAGLDVNLRIDSDANGIPAPAGLNVYRIVQEALTNAVKHAPGAPVDALVKVCDEGLYVRVHNPLVNGTEPNTSGKGLGLRGMSERAALLGGTLETENADGWTVTITAPRPTT